MTEGHFFEDLFIGQTAALSKTITEADIQMYATVSLDTNPIHLNEEMARRLRFGGRIAHGMLSASLISAVLGTHLPGPGAIYTQSDAEFPRPGADWRHGSGGCRNHGFESAVKEGHSEDHLHGGGASGDRRTGLCSGALARLMWILHDWRTVPPDARGATVALGNMDGVHLGHQSVIRAAHAARPDAPLAVLTFEPHPREVFRPDDPPFRLTLSAERSDALAGAGRGPAV